MKKILFFILILCGLCLSAGAEPVFDAADGISAEGKDAVQKILEGFDFRDAAQSLSENTDAGFLGTLWQGLVQFVFGETRAALSIPLTVAALSVLCGLLGKLGDGKGAGEVGFFIAYAACVGLAAAAVGDAAELARRTAEDMSTFTGTAMPALAVLSVSAGSASAAALHPALLSAGAAASLLISRVGIPAVYVSLALSVVGNLSGHTSLRMLSSVIRKTALWIVCGSLTLFSAVISVTGYAAGTLDGIAAKGIKYATSSLIPVLGGLLSDSAEAVSFSALAVKNAAGAAGMLLLLLLTLYPVIKTAISALLYRLSAAVAAAGADSRISSALSDMADTLATLSGMTAAAGVLSMLVIGMLTRFSDVGVMLR
ncbi:MAG: stage III sporulation protein AE [Clostridia bacterium]|nr:stage III sporulation protein AE [Clostridia bacterium]